MLGAPGCPRSPRIDGSGYICTPSEVTELPRNHHGYTQLDPGRVARDGSAGRVSDSVSGWRRPTCALYTGAFPANSLRAPSRSAPRSRSGQFLLVSFDFAGKCASLSGQRAGTGRGNAAARAGLSYRRGMRPRGWRRRFDQRGGVSSSGDRVVRTGAARRSRG